MKTTIELPDGLFREAKATAARRGTSLKNLVREAIEEKLGRESSVLRVGEKPPALYSKGIRPSSPDWPVPPPDVPKEELRRIHKLIWDEFDSDRSEDRI